MLDEKIELLFNTIKERTHQWDEYVQLFGEDHILTKSVFNSITGLEEAFQLLSGKSFSTVMIEKIRQNFNNASVMA